MGVIEGDEAAVTAVCNLLGSDTPAPGQAKANCSKCRRRVSLSEVTVFQLTKREHTILCVSCARKQIGRERPIDKLLR